MTSFKTYHYLTFATIIFTVFSVLSAIEFAANFTAGLYIFIVYLIGLGIFIFAIIRTYRDEQKRLLFSEMQITAVTLGKLGYVLTILKENTVYTDGTTNISYDPDKGLLQFKHVKTGFLFFLIDCYTIADFKLALQFYNDKKPE